MTEQRSSPVVTHHVLKQLFGDKVVLSTCLLPCSDWTSGVWRNRVTAIMSDISKQQNQTKENSCGYQTITQPHFLCRQEVERQNKKVKGCSCLGNKKRQMFKKMIKIKEQTNRRIINSNVNVFVGSLRFFCSERVCVCVCLCVCLKWMNVLKLMRGHTRYGSLEGRRV